MKDSTRRVIAQLAVNATELADALRPMLKASQQSASTAIMLSYDRGQLVVDAGGAFATASATGFWAGTATALRSLLRVLALPPGKSIQLEYGMDGRLRIGQMTVDALWSARAKPQIDLPLDAGLAQLLRLRIAHSD